MQKTEGRERSMLLSACCLPCKFLQSCFGGGNDSLAEKEEQMRIEDKDIPLDKFSFWIPRRHSAYTEMREDSISISSTSLDDLTFDRQRSLSLTSASLSNKSLRYSFRQVLGDVAYTLGQLQPALYESKEELVETNEEAPPREDSTILSDKVHREDNEIYFGTLIFRTQYLEEEKRLLVYLDKACDLPSKGVRKSYDTFVRLALHPTNRGSKSSRSIKNSLHPHYHEEFTFSMGKKMELSSTVLRLSVYDYERQGRYDAIGHVLLTLDHSGRREQKMHCLPLRSMSLPACRLGEILLSLCYTPAQHKLTVVVMKGRALRLEPAIQKLPLLVNKDEMYDTYAKVTLMCGGEKVKRTKTSVVPVSRNPVYNQAFHFVVPVSFLDDTSIVITILARGTLKRDFVIGRVVSGPFVHHTRGERLTHWGQMLQWRRPVMQWRNLYV